MKIKNALSICLSKFTLIYKATLFFLLVLLILSFLAIGIINPIIDGLKEDITALNVGGSLGDYLKGMFSGGNAEPEFNAFMDSIKGVGNIISNFNTEIIVSFIIFFIIVFIATVVICMAFYSISDIIHTFMSSNSKYGFTANFIANIKKSFSFAIVYAPISILMFIGGVAIALGMGFLFGKIHPIVGLFAVYFVVWALISIRRAMFIFVVPIMVVDHLSVSQAIAKNFEYIKGKFGIIFGAYLIIYIIGAMITLICSTVTLGVALLVSIAAVVLFMNTIDLVEFYHVRGLKYYIDDQTVVNPNKKYKDAIADEDTFSL